MQLGGGDMKILDKLEAVSLPNGNYVVEEGGLRYTATFDDELVMEAAEVVLLHSDKSDFATKAEVISRARHFGWLAPGKALAAK